MPSNPVVRINKAICELRLVIHSFQSEKYWQELPKHSNLEFDGLECLQTPFGRLRGHIYHTPKLYQEVLSYRLAQISLDNWTNCLKLKLKEFDYTLQYLNSLIQAVTLNLFPLSTAECHEYSD